MAENMEVGSFMPEAISDDVEMPTVSTLHGLTGNGWIQMTIPAIDLIASSLQLLDYWS